MSPADRNRSAGAKTSRAGSWLAIPLFVGGYLALGLFWPIPNWVAIVYAGMSVLTFIAYAVDKSRAKRGAWRVSEATLLGFGLLGGWPGAIAAQELLRHKTIKQSFRIQFWVTVVANVLAFVVMTVVVTWPSVAR